MTKKLIDWASAPNNVTVVNLTDKADEWSGELLGSVTNKTMLIKRTKLSESMGIDVVSIAPCLQKYLRLAPVEQQAWLVYEGGVTVIPEWAEFCFKVKDYKRKTLGHPQIDADLYTEGFTDRVISDNTVYLTGQAFAYKITDIKNGWTDNPDEVAREHK